MIFKTAFVFPGQGAQKTGMGLDLYEHSEDIKKLYEKADKILGFSLSEMCFRGSEEDLRQTINTQPAIYVMSVAISQLLKENGIKPDITAGHSIGEYAALTTAGVISFEDGIKLVRERGRLMNEAGIKAPGTMAAIMGMKFDDVKKYCEEASEAGIVEVANFNSPEQIVISGEIAGVEKAMEIMKANGAKRVVPLKVGAAFHSRLMKEAAEIFAELIDKAEFKKPEIPVGPRRVLCPANTAKSIVSRPTFISTSPAVWAISTTVVAWYFLAIKKISSTGAIKPNTLLAWLITTRSGFTASNW